MLHNLKSKVLEPVEQDFKDCLSFYNSKGLVKSNKQLSEDLSGLLETQIEKNYKKAVAPKVDNMPDIVYNGIPIEIKVTNGEQWRGGAYSKRDGFYILVSWAIENGNVKLFVCGTTLTEKDWQGGLKNNYYATVFGKKQLAMKEDKKVYRGNILRYKKGKQTCTKVERL